MFSITRRHGQCHPSHRNGVDLFTLRVMSGRELSEGFQGCCGGVESNEDESYSVPIAVGVMEKSIEGAKAGYWNNAILHFRLLPRNTASKFGDTSGHCFRQAVREKTGSGRWGIGTQVSTEGVGRQESFKHAVINILPRASYCRITFGSLKPNV